MSTMYYIRTGDRRWRVREAVSVSAACNAIAHARVLGSIGSKDVETIATDGPYSAWPRRTLADVVEVNSDLTDRQPYTEAY